MRISDVDLHLLRVFATVARCGGFAAAQAELNIGSSTISRHVADLERRLGMRLCVRGPAGFELTDEGRQVLAASDRLAGALDGFADAVRRIGEVPGGQLTVGITGNLIFHPESRVTEAIRSFSAAGSGVHLVVQLATPLQLERALTEREFEVGIGPFPERIDRSLAHHRLFFERQKLYCAARHPFFAREDAAITQDDVFGAPFAQRGYISVAQEPFKRNFNIMATAYTDEGVAQLVLSGLYVGFLPEHYAVHWVEKGLMRAVTEERFGYQVWYHLAYPKGGMRTRASEIFVDHLLQAHGFAAEGKRRAGGR